MSRVAHKNPSVDNDAIAKKVIEAMGSQAVPVVDNNAIAQQVTNSMTPMLSTMQQSVSTAIAASQSVATTAVDVTAHPVGGIAYSDMQQLLDILSNHTKGSSCTASTIKCDSSDITKIYAIINSQIATILAAYNIVKATINIQKDFSKFKKVTLKDTVDHLEKLSESEAQDFKTVIDDNMNGLNEIMTQHFEPLQNIETDARSYLRHVMKGFKKEIVKDGNLKYIDDICVSHTCFDDPTILDFCTVWEGCFNPNLYC